MVMLRKVFYGLLCAAWVGAAEGNGAELVFPFAETPLNEVPKGFRSALTGQGAPGDWRMVLDEVPPTMAPLTPNAVAATRRPVLAQLSGDVTDERYPLLIYEGETFGDFRLSTRFKLVSGALEQMAGVAFRLQDENNYYYIRASGVGRTFRFFKLVNGQRGQAIGPEIEIPRGVWHQLSVECKGNQIRCWLNEKEIIPTMTDNTFSAGKIAFWTKSDSVSYFVDAKIVYTPREGLGSVLVREIMERYPRLEGLKIFLVPQGKSEPVIVASNRAEEQGRAGGKVESDVIGSDRIYYGKSGQKVIVTMPLHDRNGDTVAAVQVTMKSFKGQTESNAIARATPIVKMMESRIRNADELWGK